MTHCNVCEDICNVGRTGNAICVDFPYGHPLDSMDHFLTFCSDKCLIEYIIIEYNNNKGPKNKI